MINTKINDEWSTLQKRKEKKEKKRREREEFFNFTIRNEKKPIDERREKNS